MVKVAIVGCNGKMGGFVAQAVEESASCETLFGVDAFGTSKYAFPVYRSFDEAPEKPDVMIDFSNPVVLDGMLDYALKNSVPCVICTTGYSQEQIAQIKAASEKIAIFFSGNMSLGINLLIELAFESLVVLVSLFVLLNFLILSSSLNFVFGFLVSLFVVFSLAYRLQQKYNRSFLFLFVRELFVFPFSLTSVYHTHYNRSTTHTVFFQNIFSARFYACSAPFLSSQHSFRKKQSKTLFFLLKICYTINKHKTTNGGDDC